MKVLCGAQCPSVWMGKLDGQDSPGIWERKIILFCPPYRLGARKKVAVLRFSHQGEAGDQAIPEGGKLGISELARMWGEREHTWGRAGGRFQGEEAQLRARGGSFASAQRETEAGASNELTGCGCLRKEGEWPTGQGPDRAKSLGEQVAGVRAPCAPPATWNIWEQGALTPATWLLG